METFSPEFAAFWPTEGPNGEPKVSDPGSTSTLSASQQVAFEELVERVNAARSIL